VARVRLCVKLKSLYTVYIFHSRYYIYNYTHTHTHTYLYVCAFDVQVNSYHQRTAVLMLLLLSSIVGGAAVLRSRYYFVQQIVQQPHGLVLHQDDVERLFVLSQVSALAFRLQNVSFFKP